MRILNVRSGFATNSSSSHSILILASREQAEQIRQRDALDGYGWEQFTLVDKSLKRHYLASQIAERLGYDSWEVEGSDRAHHNALVLEQIEELMGLKLTSLPTLPTYVDHQSEWGLPLDWNGEDLHAGFIRELRKFLERPEVIVLGGNDNGGSHPLSRSAKRDGMYYDAYDGPGQMPEGARPWETDLPREHYGFVARKDPLGFWTLFNRANGSKMRITFGKGVPAAGSLPELMDIKITDYCPFGCSFCYQDSTPEGKHASLASMKRIAETLGEAQVFEVAIGGGEPTLHPNFLEICKEFSKRGIVVNFTTRNLAWLRKPDFVKALAPHVGSFAYSVQTAKDVVELSKALNASAWLKSDDRGYDFRNQRPNVHVVMGTVNQRTFSAILKACVAARLQPTLLGWKRVGRADSGPKYPYLDWWLQATKDAQAWKVGIDTTLAAESAAAGQLDDFPAYSFHTEDGKWSGYIDAVSGEIAPSSWEPQRGSRRFQAETWLKDWRDLGDAA